WVRAHRDEPFFLYVQTMDVHGYVAPPPWRDKYGVPSVEHEPSPTEEASKTVGTLPPEQLEALKAMRKLPPQRLEACKAMGKLSPEQLKVFNAERFAKLAQLPPERLSALSKLSAEQRSSFRRFHPDRYDEAVAYTDHVFGRFVDALGELGLADRT